MIDLDTFRRASISLNRDNQAIQLIEGMAESEAEKLMILDFTQPGNAAPDGPGGLPFREWYRTVTSQMPAVLYRLLNEYKIPPHLRHPRYGVAYRNEIENRLSAPSEEEVDTELEELLYLGIFVRRDLDGNQTFRDRQTLLSAGEIIDRILANDSPVKFRALKRPEFADSRRVGNLLTRWYKAKGGDCLQFTFKPLSPRKTRTKYLLTRKIEEEVS
jgi:hypothetical protein